MEILDLVQGSPEWHAHRASHFNASDAPAMMGVSSYKTRSELLRELSTGIPAEVDQATQRRFDEGHRFEALARPLAEEIIGEGLYPITGTNGKLSASFDGLTLMGDVGFEHKRINDRIREAIKSGGQGDSLPMEYQVQVAQQRLVSGCERILFMATNWADDGTLLEKVFCWCTPNPDLEQAIMAGWQQFEADLSGYVPEVVEAKPVGRTPETLPALHIEVTGKVTASNLAEYKALALDVFGGINRNLTTDQEFADAEKVVKWCGDVEARLAAAKEHALSQTASIDELFKAIDDISAEARRTRLELEKLVKARKDAIRGEIVIEGRKALADHVTSLNTRLGKPYMPPVSADFAGAIKNKRTVESLRDAVNTTLANAKIEASSIADRIQINLGTLRELAANHAFLFADTASIVLKAPDDLAALVKLRIADHVAAEEKRMEAERERIRAEERARAAQIESERIQREQAEANRIHQAQQPQHVLKAEPVTDDATDRGTAANESPRGGAMGAGQAAAVAPAGEPATLKLGDICSRLGLTMTAAFVADTLGIQPSATDKRAVLYSESQFADICDALIDHISKAKAVDLMAA